MTTQPGGTRSLKEQVAEEVRVALVRKRMSGSALARILGKEQTWVSRRLTGTTAFDLDDLQLVANALGIRVEVLINGGSTTPPSLPHLDSNQEPFDYRLLHRSGAHKTADRRIARTEPIAA